MAAHAVSSSANGYSSAVYTKAQHATVTPRFFFGITKSAAGITITKASTAKGGQAPLTFPLTLAQARDLVDALVKFVS